MSTGAGRSVRVTLYWGDLVDVVGGASNGRPKVKFRKRESGAPAVTVDASHSVKVTAVNKA
jgi:hypothetical protein